MKAIITFFVLFSLTLGVQQSQAQSGKSYQEWLKESRAKSKTPAKKTPAKGKTTAAKSGKEAAAPAPALAPPSGTFRGTLACSSCQGIRTELVLTGSPKDASRSFTMKQIYVGLPADKNVVVGSGKWILAKGNKQNPEAVILQLIPTAGDLDLMYFLQVSESEVKLLDRQQNEISASENYSLRKL
jgi:hypothetical protein